MKLERECFRAEFSNGISTKFWLHFFPPGIVLKAQNYLWSKSAELNIQSD